MSRRLAAAGGYRCIAHTPLPVMSSSLPPQSESESSLALQGACEVCPRRLPAPPAWEPSESESESREPASGGARHPPALPVMSISLPAAPRSESESESESSLSREPASDAVRGAGTRPHRPGPAHKKRWAPTSGRPSVRLEVLHVCAVTFTAHTHHNADCQVHALAHIFYMLSPSPVPDHHVPCSHVAHPFLCWAPILMMGAHRIT